MSEGEKDRGSDGGKDRRSKGEKDRGSEGEKDWRSKGGNDRRSGGGKDRGSEGEKDQCSEGEKVKKSEEEMGWNRETQGQKSKGKGGCQWKEPRTTMSETIDSRLPLPWEMELEYELMDESIWTYDIPDSEEGWHRREKNR